MSWLREENSIGERALVQSDPALHDDPVRVIIAGGVLNIHDPVQYYPDGEYDIPMDDIMWLEKRQ